MPKYYKTNFLSEVIFKIQFPILLDLRDKSPSEFQTLIRDKFPDIEEKNYVNLPEDVSKEDLRSFLSPDKLWIFKSLSEDRLVELSKSHLLFGVKKYKHFKDFSQEFQFVLDSFKRVYGDNLVIKKTGLRYVNQIELAKGDTFEWKGYIKDELFSVINKYFKDSKSLIKMMGILELKEKEFNIKFRFGMPNPDYPNKITKKFFLLDYDCVSNEPIKILDINNRLIESHNQIEELFEGSIMDELRKEMVVINNGI